MPMSQSVFNGMSEGEKEVAKNLKMLGILRIYESPTFVYDEKERRN